jgi:hypothetical protein
MPSPRGTNREGLYLPASWATKGGVASAYYERMALDAKPRSTSRSSRPKSFEEFYNIRVDDRGRVLALDQVVRRGGNIVHENGQEPEVMVDAEPPAGQEIRGRAPPWGPNDLPAQRSVTEPKMGMDPVQSERQRRAMGAAASGNSRLGISPEVGRRFLHGDQIETELPSERTREPATVRAGQQGDQAEHEDEPEDEKLIRRVLSKLGFNERDVREAIARDRAGRRRMAGDAALSRRSFFATYPEARGLADGLPAFTPRVLW